MKVSLLVWIQQKNIASEMDIEPKFRTRRQGKRKKHFDEQNEQDEEIQQFVVDSFRAEYFNVMIHAAIASLTTRFKQMKEFDSIFGFSFNAENLKSLDEADLLLRYKVFWKKFLMITYLMLRSMIFFQELKVLQMTLPNSLMSALEILEFVMVAIPDHGLPDPINPDPPEKTPTRPDPVTGRARAKIFT
jgi:hypothetical protein